MAHYCILDENNQVINAFRGVEETELIDGLPPEEWYSNFHGKQCLRYSINTKAGIHSNGGVPFRKNPGGLGYIYDVEKDAFIPPKVYNSWILDDFTCQWKPPVPRPEGRWKWDEDSISWIEDNSI